MRAIRDIFKIIGTGLAIYGGYCLVTGTVSKKVSENWQTMLDQTGDWIESFTGMERTNIIDAECEEVN